MCIESARYPGKEGGDGKGQYLVPGTGHTHCLSGDLILPQGEDRAALPGADHGIHHRHAQGSDPEYPWEGGVFIDAVETPSAAGEGEILDHHADDLTESQGDDGEVVAPQPQGRNADEHAEHRSQCSAEEQRQREFHQGRQVHVQGEERRGIGADGHEARMTQHQFAQYAGGEIEGGSQQHIDADGDDDALVLHRDEARGHQAIEETKAQYQCQEVSPAAQGSPFCLIHALHLLRPFPAHCVPADPKA